MTNQVQTKTVPLENIILKDNIQQRELLDYECVQEYTEALRGGAVFPPIVLFSDGNQLILADGLHRYIAFQEANRKEIDALILQGGEREAIFYACGANAEHGLRRTNQDKRKAVLTLLNDAEWHQMSDNMISGACRVSQPFVSRIRKEMITYNGFKSDQKRIGADGRVTDVSRIGAKTKQPAQASESLTADNDSCDQTETAIIVQNVPNQAETVPEGQQEHSVTSTVSDGADNDVVSDADQTPEDIQDAGSTDERVPNVPSENEDVQEPLQDSVIDGTLPDVVSDPDVTNLEGLQTSDDLHSFDLESKVIMLERLIRQKDEQLENCRLRINELENEIETLKNENAYLLEKTEELESVT